MLIVILTWCKRYVAGSFESRRKGMGIRYDEINGFIDTILGSSGVHFNYYFNDEITQRTK